MPADRFAARHPKVSSVAATLLRGWCTLAFVIVGSLGGVSMAIAMFISTGMLQPGEPMYVGVSTPALGQALGQAVACLGIAAALAYARHAITPARHRQAGDRTRL
jgi:hypothetical protein